MKAALYTRVSTEEQVEGFSLAAQLNALTKYCEDNKIDIFEVYSDEGVSGQKENRPQFQRMLTDADKKLFGVILVHKFDRFARKVELSQKVKNKLKKSDIAVISITEPLEDSPMGFFVGGLHDLLAEYYVRNLAIESKKGHVERASQGQHNGSVPYGYKIDKLTGDMVIREDQAAIVRLIYDLYNNKGYGSTKTAAYLNENRIDTAVRGTWNHFTVNRILKNPKYMGKILYDGNIYDGVHSPIISQEDFELAQKNRGDRTWKRSYRGANFEKFVLLGLLKCGQCGFTITLFATYSKKKHNGKINRRTSQFYYACNHRTHYIPGQPHPCSNHKYRAAAKLQKYVEDFIKTHVLDHIDSDLRVSRKTPITGILDARKEKVIAEKSRAKAAYLAGVFTLDEYTDLKNNHDAELAEVQLLKEKEAKGPDLEIFRSKVKSAWDEYELAETPPEKRRILQKFIESILLFEDRIEIIFYS